MFVVPSGDPPVTADVDEKYIAAFYRVNGQRQPLVVIGDGGNTTDGRETYINRAVKRGTRYYFFIRLFSSAVS